MLWFIQFLDWYVICAGHFLFVTPRPNLCVATVFIQAAFSFLGTEIVALTAAEAENVSSYRFHESHRPAESDRFLLRQPRRNVPKAIKRVFARIVFF